MKTPTFDFYSEETTKTAVENVTSLQKHLATYRNIIHPVNSLSADVTRMMADTLATSKNIVWLCAVATVTLMFTRHWLPAVSFAICTAAFYVMYKAAAARFSDRLVDATKNTDDYFNATIREQLLPVSAAVSLRLCTYENNAVLFIDGAGKEWTRRELIKVLNSTEGTETALQFLLSCAVFGWPEEGNPVRELTVEVLGKLRSIPVEDLQPAKDLLN